MKILKLLIVLLFIAAFFSCESSTTKAKKRFIITSTGASSTVTDAGFTGYYIVDGGDMNEFDDETDGAKTSTESYYKYSKDLDANTSSIYIVINGKSTNVNSIQLLVYNDDSLVVNVSASPDSYTNKTTLNHYYAFTTASSSN